MTREQVSDAAADSPPSESVNRRTFVRRTLGGAMLGVLGVELLLQACAPTRATPAAGTTPAPNAGTGQAGGLPSYIPFKGPDPDLAATPAGIEPAYNSYPSKPVKSVTQPPLRGGEVTGYVSTVSPPPPPMEQNPVWQEVNKQLGGTLRLTISSSADYPTKLNTVIASDDLPELIYVNPATHNLANQLAFLQAKMADLTPYLSSDAVRDFPNLANFPSFAWQGPGTVYNQHVWGVPDPRPIVSNALLVHQQLLEQAGADQPKSADDLKRVLVAVTRPQADVYGFGTSSLAAFSIALFAQIFGAPNTWGLDTSGKLVKDYETEEFAAAIGFARDLYRAGVFHPNSATNTNTSADADFSAGKVVFYYTTWTGLSTVYWPQALRINPAAKLRPIAPFSADGKAKAQFYLGSGNFGNVHIRKSSPERTRELLGVVNYLAAPFGSQEQMLLSYGLPGSDYTLDGRGNPVSTPEGFATRPVPWRFLTQFPSVLYNTVNSEEFARITHAGEEAMLPAGVQNPVLAVYSATAANKNALLQSDFLSAVTDIVTGRRPLTELAHAVTDWRTKGGDTMRAEYEQALAGSKS